MIIDLCVKRFSTSDRKYCIFNSKNKHTNLKNFLCLDAFIYIYIYIYIPDDELLDTKICKNAN